MLGILAVIGLGSALIFSDKTEEQTEGLGKISDPKEEQEAFKFVETFTKKFSGKSFVNAQTGLKFRVFKSALVNTFTQFEKARIEPKEEVSQLVNLFKNIDDVIKKSLYRYSYKNNSISKNAFFHVFETKGGDLLLKETRGVLYLEGIYDHLNLKVNERAINLKKEKSDSKLHKIFHRDVNIQLENKQKATESNKEQQEATESNREQQKATKPAKNETEKPKTDTENLVSDTKTDSQTPKKEANLKIIDYSEKAIALKGTTKEMSSAIKGLGIWAKFNAKLNDGEGGKFAGWIFSKKDRETVEEFVKQYTNGEVITVKKEASGAEEKPNTKLTFAQHIQAYKAYQEVCDMVIRRGAFLPENVDHKALSKGVEVYYTIDQQFYDRRELEEKITPKNGKVKYTVFVRSYLDKEGNVWIISDYNSRDWATTELYRKEIFIKKSGKQDGNSWKDRVDMSKLTPFDIPAKVFVPKNKRKPHYDLSKNPKLKRDTLLLELMLGKMDMRMTMSFDGMQDMSVPVEEKWYTPTLAQIPDDFYRDSPWLSGQNIKWGNAGVMYSVRYNGKDAKAWLYLGDEQEERKKEIKAVDHKAMAEKFFKTADSLKSRIEKKESELEHAQTNTARRLSHYTSKRTETDELIALETYFRALGEAWKANTIHEKLKLISPQQSKKHLNPFKNATESTNYGYHFTVKVDHSQFLFEKYYSNYKDTLKEIGANSVEEAREINELLLALIGGKDKVSSEERKKQDRIKELENQWKLTKQKGFFPTPTPLAQRMVSEANIQTGDTILEPSAGVGHIAEVIREEYPQNSLEVVEYMQSLSELLELKGFKVVGDDFLKHNKKYDRIIMNPPFEKLADIDHVKHAYSLLKQGGRIVAIMSESPFFNSQNKAKAFRNWLDEVGGVSEQLPENSFKGKDAFKETGVSTRLVIIDKSEGGNSKKKDNKNLSEIEKLKAEAEELKTGVLDRFVAGIHTDEKRFQNRDNAYSSESHDRIVEAVKNGSFNWAIFDPIIVWKDPKNDKIYVISGHSRLAAFKTLSKSNAQFKKIPSKLFEGSESEAIDLALNSNTLATKETDLERANYYRKKREACEIEPQKGLSGTKLRKDCFKQVVELAKKYEGKNATKLINLSFLNPKGYLYDILKRLENSDESSKNIAWTVGQWMGEARKLYPQLTDAHENEVAKWLIEKGYGTKASQFTNKRLFLDRLKKSIDRKTEFGKFKENEPLNIAWTITKNNVEEEFDNILHELTKNSQEAEKLVKDKADEFYNGVEQGKITREKAEELLKPYIQSFSVAKSKLAKHVNSKQRVMKQGKNQTSLFGVKPKKTRSKSKLFSGIGEQAEESESKAETFYLDGEIGMFLGYVEQYEYSVVLRGAKGAGKTRFLFQIMNAFANEGKKTAFFSLEIGKHSNIISKMSDEYLSDKAKQNILIADEVPNGLQDVKDAAEDFDLICIDSYGKLGVKQEEFDKLRKQYPNTMFIFIFQSTTAGTARGGSRAEYDCGIVIQVNEGGKAVCEKNRYGSTDFTYLVFDKRLH